MCDDSASSVTLLKLLIGIAPLAELSLAPAPFLLVPFESLNQEIVFFFQVPWIHY